MTELLSFIIGALVMYLILQRPLQIKVHHVQETINSQATQEDIDKLEEEMLKDDPKKDPLYENFDETIQKVNEIMGGSDR